MLHRESQHTLDFPNSKQPLELLGALAASPYLRETRVQTTIKNTAVSMALEALNRNDAGISNRLESINSVLREVFSFVVK